MLQFQARHIKCVYSGKSGNLEKSDVVWVIKVGVDY